MARMASKAKSGFYPTPDSVTEIIKNILRVPEGARFLDPCCGYGKTLSHLAEGFDNVSTYGIELEHERLSEARSRLDRVLWGDSLVEVKLTQNAFGLLYLNPPYDYEMAAGDQADRLEARFLRRFIGAIQDGGWLVFVIPYTTLKWCSLALSRKFQDLCVYAFPEEEFWTFKQCVVFGRKVATLIPKATAEEQEKELNRIAALDAEEFLQLLPMSKSPTARIIPPPLEPVRMFSSMRVDPDEAIPIARNDGLLDALLISVTPRKCDDIRPLAPLENGHLTLLMAGGKLNGEVIQGDQRLVLKGCVKKAEEVIESVELEKGYRIKTKDKYLPTIRAIDMNRAEMLTIQ